VCVCVCVLVGVCIRSSKHTGCVLAGCSPSATNALLTSMSTAAVQSDQGSLDINVDVNRTNWVATVLQWPLYVLHYLTFTRVALAVLVVYVWIQSKHCVDPRTPVVSNGVLSVSFGAILEQCLYSL
jgi:hypothetical protein